MKSLFIMSLTLIIANSAFAKNPGVICVASTKVHVLIETEKKQVRVSHWGNIVETLAILKTDVQYLERMPAIWQTDYDLGEGYILSTSFTEGKETGTGGLYIDGQKKVDYYHCSHSEDIKR